MKRSLYAVIPAIMAISAMTARNPIIQTCFTTDPAPMVHNDTLYVYTGHDENQADFFWMQEWRVYSTTDMANWTDHGSPLAIEDFDWADDRAWAPQCIGRDGKFYFYVPLHSRITGAMAIGVAVGDSPAGPFRDAIGKPLADGSWDYIDPTVFIDDDGQAYLFWGNPQIYYVRLNRDMISFDGEIQKLDITPEAFGPGKHVPMEPDKKYTTSYTEGPWLSKHHGQYHLLYAAGGIPESIAYSTAHNPTGPWTYAGIIMPQTDWTNSFTNHAGVIDFKGRSYFFYHTGRLPGGGGFGRSVAVEQFEYNPDGSFPTIHPTDNGVNAISTFNPMGRHEAETIAWSQGVTTRQCDATGVYLSDIHDSDYTMIENVDFSDRKPRSIGVSAASGRRGGTIEVRTDSISGPIIATIDIPGTGGWEKWQYIESPIQRHPQGTHDLYFVFKGRKGPELFNLDYWILK